MADRKTIPVFMLGCFILMAVLAGTAAADGPAWINGSKVSEGSDPEHNFTTADDVYAFGYLGNYSESSQAGGRVYVVGHNDTWSNGTVLDDVSGDNETVEWSGEDNGNFSLLIWEHPLESGKYDIVLDLDVTGCIGAWTSEWGEEHITDPIWTINVTEALPGIRLTKTATTGDCPGYDPLTVKLGDTVTYCFEVENTGNVRLEGVTIVDESLEVLWSLEEPLSPGESTLESITPEGTISGEGTVTNTAIVTGTDPLGEPVTAEDSCEINIETNIAIEKTASTDGSCPGSDPLTVKIGDTVTYCYNITNTGSMGLEIWLVEDDKLGEVKIGKGEEGSTHLGPGDTISANLTYVVTESDVPQVTNMVTVVALYLGEEGVVATDTDNCTINIEHPKTPQQVPALTPIGVLALMCLLSVVAVVSIRIRRQK